jgi:hypothetical protein
MCISVFVGYTDVLVCVLVDVNVYVCGNIRIVSKSVCLLSNPTADAAAIRQLI